MNSDAYNLTFDFGQAAQGDNITILIVGILIVFFALILLFFVFLFIPKLMKVRIGIKPKVKGTSKAIPDENEISGEEGTAIAMALYMYFNEQHDTESYISTIKRVERRYSPWSSKIYSVRNQFNRY